MAILVSFLNLLTPGRPSLGIVDDATWEFRPLSLSHALPRCKGVTGLACDNRHIYTVVQSPPGIVVLDRIDLSPVTRYFFESGLDVHSIYVDCGRIFAVSAGTDEVLELSVNDAHVASECVVWRPDPTAPRFDFHHLNSICRWRGDILVSGFGKRTERNWNSAPDGFIDNISRGERLLSGVRHPHSLAVVGDTVAYCESAHRRLCFLGDDRSADLPGYTRGICTAGPHIFVGTSKQRRVSKSTGGANRETAAATPAALCTISRLSLDDLRIEGSIDLGAHATEIYDLLAIDGVERWPVLPTGDQINGATSWWRQVELTMYDIAQSTPPESTLLLARSNGWSFGDSLIGRRHIPFPKPADGATAVRELERLRRSPAQYLIFTWTSFWWLDYYPELREHLRQHFRRIVENDRVIAFDLRNSLDSEAAR